MTRMAIVAFVLLLWAPEAMSAPNCDQALKAAASQLLAPPKLGRMANSSNDEKCRVIAKQFVEAVTVRQVASTCQERAIRQRALELLDGQIQTFNDRLAEQLCTQ